MEATELIAVPEGAQDESSGSIVYWALSGEVSCQGLTEELADAFFPNELAPALPTKAQSLHRAAMSAFSGSGQMIRALRGRNQWALVQETMSEDMSGLEWQTLFHFGVREDEVFTEMRGGSAITGDGDAACGAEELHRRYGQQTDVLTPQDISAWLLRLVVRADGVGLRDRGGIYFVPRDRLDEWRGLVGVLGVVAQHKVFEIPAYKSEDAVEAILTAVRAEAQREFDAMELYLSDETSTKGLNSWERKISALRSKLAHYAQLLGVALPDMDARLETLTGALVAVQCTNAG